MKTLTVGIAVLVAGVLVLVGALVAANRALDDNASATAGSYDGRDGRGMSGSATAKGTSFAGAAPANADGAREGAQALPSRTASVDAW